MKKEKKSKKLRDRSVEQPRENPKESKKSGSQDEERDMDFGGLPQRDLKKNLGGCG